MSFHYIAGLALVSFFLAGTGVFLRRVVHQRVSGGLSALSFILTVTALNHFDVMGRDFNTSGIWLLVYNVLRVLPLIFWSMIFTSTGDLFLSIFQKYGTSGFIAIGDRVLARFFLGAAFCSLIFFIFGLIGFLKVEGGCLYGAFFLVFSKNVIPLWEDGIHRAQVWFSRLGNVDRLAAGFSLLILILFAARLFFVNTMYPAGSGCDVYNHYLPYLKEVIRTGTTAPNDVWYHFFYSKGVGISFFAMLSGGVFGPKSMAFLLVLWSAALVGSLTFRITKSALYGLLSSVIFLGVFATGSASTGEFFKHHVLLLGFLFVTFWLLVSFVWGRGNDEAILGAMVCSICGIIAIPTAIAFFGILIGLVFLLLLLAKKRRQAAKVFALGVVVIMVFSGLLILNYSLTGLYLETPIRFFWSFADSNRFSHWVSPYLIQYCFEGSGQGVGKVSIDRLALITKNWVLEILRLNLLHYLVPSTRSVLLLVISLLAAFFLFRRSGFRCLLFLSLSCVFLAISVCLSKLVDQEGSIHRMFVFAVPFSVVTVIAIWYSALHAVLRPTVLRRLAAPVLLCISLLTLNIKALAKMQYDLPNAYISFRQTLVFFLGKVSIRQALIDSGQLWLSAEEARQIIGPDAGIITFVINGGIYGASCSFPGKGLLTEVNFVITSLWHRVAFGPAQEAKDLLLKEKITGFLFDLKDPMLFGAIPYSDLFSPKSLRKNFDLFQTGPTTYLARLVVGAPVKPWPENILRSFEIKRQSLATLSGRADFKKMMTTAIEKSLGQDGTSTKRRSFLQVEPKLRQFLGGLLNPNSVHEVVTKTASTLFSQPEFAVDRNNLCKVADEIGSAIEESVQQSLKSEVGTSVLEMLKNDTSTSKMKNVYDNVKAIYLYNEGNTSLIQRPQDLPPSKGWQ
jgi:hypothetical protein